MQFIITGFDGTDAVALARRQAVRQQHIKRGNELLATGNLTNSAALLHDDGSMKGSIYVMDFLSESANQVYLNTEPYIVGDVWRHIDFRKSKTSDPWQFNCQQERFE